MRRFIKETEYHKNLEAKSSGAGEIFNRKEQRAQELDQKETQNIRVRH